MIKKRIFLTILVLLLLANVVQSNWWDRSTPTTELELSVYINTSSVLRGESVQLIYNIKNIKDGRRDATNIEVHDKLSELLNLPQEDLSYVDPCEFLWVDPKSECTFTILKNVTLFFKIKELKAGTDIFFGYNTTISSTLEPNRYYKASHITIDDFNFKNPGINPKKILPSYEVLVKNSPPRIVYIHAKNYSESSNEIKFAGPSNISFACLVDDIENDTSTLICDLIHIINRTKHNKSAIYNEILMKYNESSNNFELNLDLIDVGKHEFEIRVFDGFDNISSKYNQSIFIDIDDLNMNTSFILLPKPYCYDELNSRFIISREGELEVKCFSEKPADDIEHLTCTLIETLSNKKYPMVFDELTNTFKYDFLLKSGEYKFEIEIYYPYLEITKTHGDKEKYYIETVSPAISYLSFLIKVVIIVLLFIIIAPLLFKYMEKKEKYAPIIIIILILVIFILIFITAVDLYYKEIIYLCDVHKYELFILIGAMLLAQIIQRQLGKLFKIVRTTATKISIGLFIIIFIIALNFWIDKLSNSNYDSNIRILGSILILVLIIIIYIIDKHNDKSTINNNLIKIYSLLLTLLWIGILLFAIDIVNHPTDSIYGLIIILIFEFLAVIVIQVPVLVLIIIDEIFKKLSFQ